MAKGKKSFLLHIDSLDILDDLDNEQSGLLFKAIKAYQKNEQIELDGIVRIAFSPFKNQFIRDDEKYKTTCERRALAGSSGGKKKQANLANASNSKQELTKVADNKNKNKTNSDSDSDSDSDKEDQKTTTAKPAKLNFQEEDLNFSKWFYEQLLFLNPKQKKPKSFDKWANTIRLIRIGDDKTYKEMRDLFMWVCRDDFWKGNIQSPDKFRKQWDMLFIQMQKGFNKVSPRDALKASEERNWHKEDLGL